MEGYATLLTEVHVDLQGFIVDLVALNAGLTRVETTVVQAATGVKDYALALAKGQIPLQVTATPDEEIALLRNGVRQHQSRIKTLHIQKRKDKAQEVVAKSAAKQQREDEVFARKALLIEAQQKLAAHSARAAGPVVEESEDEEPHADEPHADEPHADEPHADEPEDDEPEATTSSGSKAPVTPELVAEVSLQRTAVAEVDADLLKAQKGFMRARKENRSGRVLKDIRMNPGQKTPFQAWVEECHKAIYDVAVAAAAE